MKLIFILLSSASVSFGGQKPPPVSDWPVRVISFSSKVTLTDIFDSGLRPYYFPQLERSFLEAKHQNVIFKTHSNDDFPELASERITMHVNDPWLVETGVTAA